MSCGVFFAFLGGLNYFILLIKSGSFLNPLGLILLFWTGLIILSNFSLSGLNVPSIESQLVFIAALTFACVGGVFSTSFISIDSHRLNERNLNYLKRALCFFALPIVFLLFSRMAKIVMSSSYAHFVLLTRSGIGSEGLGRSLIFGTGYFRIVFDVLVLPIIYSSFFIGLSLLVFSKKKAMYFLAITSLMLYSLIMSSRDSLLEILMLTIFGFVLHRSRLTNRRRYAGKNMVFIAVLLLVILISFLFINSYRAASGFDLFDNLLHYGITYHTLGFVLFDIAYRQPQSFLHNKAYGHATFGFPKFCVEILARAFLNLEIISDARFLVREFNKQVLVGHKFWASKEDLLANAFYSAVAVFYVDFGYVGIIFYPFLYGFFTMSSYLTWRKKGGQKSFVMVLLFIYLGYNSLMMPVVIRSFFWPFVILLLLILYTKIQLRRPAGLKVCLNLLVTQKNE